MINITDYFERAFVINLDCTPEKLKAFNERARVAGVTGFERYRAVHGDSCPHPAWWRSGNGAWGCLMSHLRIVQDCLMDKVENYVVFEDDACFSKDFADRLPEVMKTLSSLKKGWDMFYLGGQHLWEHGLPTPYAEGIVKATNVNRTHAYAVNERFMVKFQQHVIHAPDYMDKHVKPVKGDKEKGIEPENEWFPHIDHQLGDIHKEVTTLAVTPWLCGQAAGRSNISGAENEEQWWDDLGWGER